MNRRRNTGYLLILLALATGLVLIILSSTVAVKPGSKRPQVRQSARNSLLCLLEHFALQSGETSKHSGFYQSGSTSRDSCNGEPPIPRS